ncbi:MAG: MFS transporter [Gammaproteobacteria bacterium]|nr:MFS transporter [Gammaproteobacteria bacterium]
MRQAGWGREPFSDAYRRYVLGVLMLAYVANIMDRSVLAILIEPIRHEFHASDAQLGVLGGIAFAFFYSLFGIPIAAWADRGSRRNVLALAVACWSVMTALCGAATSFVQLLLARIGTGVGEAGGSPPSHSLIADYFAPGRRATALSLYAMAVPIGGMLGALLGGWSNQLYGWRLAFMLVGLPGVLIALLVWFTVAEPTRGGDEAARPVAAAPGFAATARYLWHCRSFRHLALAAGMHAIVVYGASQWTAAFLLRAHQLGSGAAGTWLALLQGAGLAGTLLGGLLSDALSRRSGDPRWSLWVPAAATLACLPFQLIGYQSAALAVALACFALSTLLGATFFGPSFSVTQSLAPPRMRAVAASVLLFVQTMVGLGIGPWAVGLVSDYLKPTLGDARALGWGLTLVAFVNIWSAVHYLCSARSYRADLAAVRAAAG